ncbi:hypothetical protein [Paenimyroides aestuarii]|uniref:DUF3887 domain-containing protein n=1 Tax=Paenimyroides aestuarii TaxID=2968490 RepID=A0ABY5NW87_9FLAO|nr:hypothetical protein [Paenimyroides aestuarii]UUV22723.1 hypothetical protein NPX36_06695 [Paenimyroides aestuarii]
MIKSLIFGIISISVLILTGCNFNKTYSNRISDKQDAEVIAERLYVLMEKSQFEEAEQLFSEKFLNVTPSDSLQKMFLKIKSLGEFQSKELQDWKTFVLEGSKPKSQYALYYKVDYSHHEAKETIRMEKKGDKIMIVGYEVYSDGFSSK